jgi:hypothetical protein
MTFNLTINLDNAAWQIQDEAIDLDAIAEALTKVCDSLWSGSDRGTIIDTNGNLSGEWRVQ